MAKVDLKTGSSTERQPTTEEAAALEKLRNELAAREVDARFMQGLAEGSIGGDVVKVDSSGREVAKKKPKLICDL